MPPLKKALILTLALVAAPVFACKSNLPGGCLDSPPTTTSVMPEAPVLQFSEELLAPLLEELALSASQKDSWDQLISAYKATEVAGPLQPKMGTLEEALIRFSDLVKFAKSQEFEEEEQASLLTSLKAVLAYTETLQSMYYELKPSQIKIYEKYNANNSPD